MDHPQQHETFNELKSVIDAQEARIRESRESRTDALNQLRMALDRLGGLVEEENQAGDSATQALRKAFGKAQHELNEICGADATAVQAARNHVEQMEQETAALRQELEAQQSRAAEAESDCARLREELAAAQAEAQALSGRIDESEHARRAAESSIEDLRADVTGAQARADQAQASQERLEEELESLRAELDALRTTQGEALSKEEAEGLETRLADANARAAVLDAQLQEARNQAQSLEARLTEADARGAEIERRLQEEMTKNTRSVLAEQLAVALREAEEAQEELQRLKSMGGQEVARTTPAVETKTPEQRLREAARSFNDPSMVPLGEILTASGLVSRDQVEAAAEEQKRTPNRHIGAILIDQGHVAEESVAQALAIQCGCAYTRINERSVDSEAAALISERLASQHCCIPLSATGDTLLLAIVNPLNLVALEDIERATGRRVTAVAATASDIKQAIEKYYWEPE